MNIGIITSSISRRAGGLFESVRASALGLHRLGHRVTVYGLEDEHSAADFAAWAPVSVVAFPRVGPAALGYSPGMSHAVRKSNHDLLHLHGLWTFPSIVCLRWGASSGRPVVISPRGMLDPWALRNSSRRKQIARLLFEDRNLRRAACLHALAAAEAQAMRQVGLRKPIAIMPNGVDIPVLKGDGPIHQWPGLDQRKVLLFLGRIHPKKGVQETIEAWAKLKVHSPLTAQKWRLVIAGWDDGGHLPALRHLVVRLSLEKDVEFHGPHYGAAKGRLLSQSSAFILASHSEGLPMGVLEACAHELPVFITRACNLPEAFDHRAAIEITPDPVELAACLGQFLASADISDYGRNGRRLVERSFSWEGVARKHADLYAWLLGDAERPQWVDLGVPESQSDECC
ncbi:glycosyltransferase [Mesorhizobium sp. M1006]|uniref:glycosyltransferase n=1 Tax=Mesorhizobium sp. M1006 TaxID=2957048 RepID=UPI00333B67DA